QRELRAGPAEVIEERGEEDAGGVVARAEDEEQGREEAADHEPGPALAAGHAGASTSAFAIGGTRTRLPPGGQGGGDARVNPKACERGPQLPGRPPSCGKPITTTVSMRNRSRSQARWLDKKKRAVAGHEKARHRKRLPRG